MLYSTSASSQHHWTPVSVRAQHSQGEFYDSTYSKACKNVKILQTSEEAWVAQVVYSLLLQLRQEPDQKPAIASLRDQTVLNLYRNYNLFVLYRGAPCIRIVASG